MFNKNNNYCKMVNSNKNLIVGNPENTSKFYIDYILSHIDDESSYIILDKDGFCYNKYKDSFLKNNYDIKLLSLDNADISIKYNPFMLVKNDNIDIDIEIIARTFYNSILLNNKLYPCNSFFKEGEYKLLKALAIYVYEVNKEYPKKQTLMEINDILKNNRDILCDLFNKHYIETNSSMFKACWDDLKILPLDVLKQIIIQLSFDLSVFNINQVTNLFSDNEISMNNIANRKTVIFVQYNSNDLKYNFIPSLFITQAFNILYEQEHYKEKLVYNVRFILNDFYYFSISYFSVLALYPNSKIKIDIIIPSLKKLIDKYNTYNDFELLVYNCDNIILFNTNIIEDINYICNFANADISKLDNKHIMIISLKNGTKKIKIVPIKSI